MSFSPQFLSPEITTATGFLCVLQGRVKKNVCVSPFLKTQMIAYMHGPLESAFFLNDIFCIPILSTSVGFLVFLPYC